MASGCITSLPPNTHTCLLKPYCAGLRLTSFIFTIVHVMASDIPLYRWVP